MADAAYIQNRIYYGYGKAAQRLGLQFDVYRSATPINPIQGTNIISNGYASFNVSWSYMSANKYGNVVWQTVIDANSLSDGGTDAKVGDYLKGFDLRGKPQTFLIIAEQLQLPILSVECNHIVTITRATQDATQGFSNNYSGYLPVTAETLASGLPVSLYYMQYGQNNKMKLPTDTRLPQLWMYAPNLGGVVYKNRDEVIDEENNRYVISMAELTDLGWRFVLEQLGT
jgi:hypothetical protein